MNPAGERQPSAAAATRATALLLHSADDGWVREQNKQHPIPTPSPGPTRITNAHTDTQAHTRRTVPFHHQHIDSIILCDHRTQPHPRVPAYNTLCLTRHPFSSRFPPLTSARFLRFPREFAHFSYNAISWHSRQRRRPTFAGTRRAHCRAYYDARGWMGKGKKRMLCVWVFLCLFFFAFLPHKRCHRLRFSSTLSKLALMKKNAPFLLFLSNVIQNLLQTSQHNPTHTHMRTLTDTN